jgi:hypothetical protein
MLSESSLPHRAELSHHCGRTAVAFGTDGQRAIAARKRENLISRGAVLAHCGFDRLASKIPRRDGWGDRSGFLLIGHETWRGTPVI